MTYIDVQPHIHWKLKGLSHVAINEAPSPNLIGRQVDRSTSRQVDRSTSRQVDNSVLAEQINDIYRCTAAYPLET